MGAGLATIPHDEFLATDRGQICRETQTKETNELKSVIAV
jgi:hypothetical protein